MALSYDEVVNSEKEVLIQVDYAKTGNFDSRISLNFGENDTSRSRHLVGIGLAIFNGITSGFLYVPIKYIQDNLTNASQNQNDYAFAMSCGMLLGAVFYFVIYCILTKNKPTIHADIILPGFIIGTKTVVLPNTLWELTIYLFFRSRLDMDYRKHTLLYCHK